MSLSLDKSNWKPVRLSDVVYKVEENDRANARERFDTFIKVEHMEAESLHLRGHGSQKDEELPPTFYKIFRKGQILFPTRNPHLRRTALADCEGICGEKTLTLSVKQDVADPRLIPFLFHSRDFYDHSAGAIIGSTNPHCRWRDIANFEFLLPPKDQQAKLAELLWAADALVEKGLKIKATQKTLRSSLLKDIFTNKEDTIFISDVCKLSSGKARPKKLVNEQSSSHNFPVFGGNGIIGYSTEHLVDSRTIILGRVGEYCGAVHSSKGPCWVSDNALYVKDWLLPIDQLYVERFLEYCDLNSQQTGGGQPLITQTLVGSNKMPKPNGQTEYAMNRLKALEMSTSLLEDTKTQACQLLKSLINEIFSSPSSFNPHHS